MNMATPSAPILLTSVLTATQNGVLVYQAIRTSGTITDLRLSMLNAVAERDFGKPAIEIVGQLFSRLFPTTAKAALFERYRQVIETGEMARFEYQYKLSGQLNTDWFDISVVPMQDSIIVSYDNITQRKADAEAARQAIVLQQAFDASVNGITVFEAVCNNGSGPITDFRFVMINEAGLNMSGFTRNELLGHTLWEIYPATGINGLFSRYVAVCETGQPFAGEHYYPEYDIWREVSMVQVPNGVMVTYNDITARRKSEEAARQQAQLVENLLENIPAGIAVMNAVRNAEGRLIDFQVVRVNLALQEKFRLLPAQVLGQPLTSAFAFAGESGLLSRAIACVELGEKQAFEMPLGSQEKRGWYRVAMAPQGDQVILAVTDISDSRRAQLAQHEQAELLQSVLQASQDSIVAVDAVFDEAGVVNDFVYMMMNRAGETTINRRLDDIRGKGMLAVFPANRDTGLFDMYRQVWETGQPQQTETRYEADGVTGWFRLSIVRRGPGLLITITDTTGLHQARQLAEQQAELLQSISDNTPAGLVLWEAVYDEQAPHMLIDFRYRLANRMNTYVTGHPTETLIGQQLLERFPRFRDTEMETALRETIETGRTQHMVFTYYTDRPDGWYDAQFSRIGSDRVLMTFMDVSEQHNVQIAQKQQADTFGAVLSNIKHGLNVLHVERDETGQLADLRYEYFSNAILHDSGLTRQQIMGNTVLTLFPESRKSHFWQAYIQALETGEAQQFEEHYHHDGYDNHLICQVARIDENRLVTTYQIITELKRQQQALEVLNMELRRSNDNLQQFAYIASHDLQEPLRKIQSFGDMLDANYADVLDANGRDMIGRMQKAAERMSGLIRDLLSYSRVSTERKPFEPVSLAQLLTWVRDDLMVAMQESGAVIEWSDLPVVSGDSTQLHQLFQNLLSNAVKFRVAGVPPRVSVTYRVVFSAALPSSVVGTALAVPTTDDGKAIDRFYEINVTDNGIGFDEKYLDRIFQVFQRLHGKANYAGTGVGLAICRKVAENHRGAITASSQTGAGATFSVYLPVVDV